MSPRWMVSCALVLLFTLAPAAVCGETIARSGAGWLERIDGYAVLHLKGTHYEMGRQHGALLKEQVKGNVRGLIGREKDAAMGTASPLGLKQRTEIESIIKTQQSIVPAKYLDELRGLAAGSGVALSDVQVVNFLPERFHCSGFAVMNSATRDGTLYHGRVLDYAVDWGLQRYAVLVVAEPAGGIPFVNVTYAGFIGSVTGMNARHVSIGEMGGGGQGHWEGVPMAFLVREVLERADDLDQAIAVFRDNRRTCQYFFVIADGKTNRAVAMKASWNRFDVIQPGQSHPLLPTSVQDAVLLSAGDRYKELVRRTQAKHGQLTAETAIRLMDQPVAMKSNLHNALFEPKSTRFWVANASLDRKPAAEQKYFSFVLSDLLKRKP